MINLHLTKITKLFDLENLELYGIQADSVHKSEFFTNLNGLRSQAIQIISEGLATVHIATDIIYVPQVLST